MKIESEELERQMIAYRGGDDRAFEPIHAALSSVLRSYLCTLTRDRTRAEDLLQETFLQIHRSREGYRPGRPVRPWAFGVARYVFLMELRARRSRPLDATNDRVSIERPVPNRLEQRVADRDALGRQLVQLSSAQRDPLLLHHVWGYSFGEIAERLGIRQSTAKVRAHRGVARLRSTCRE